VRDGDPVVGRRQRQRRRRRGLDGVGRGAERDGDDAARAIAPVAGVLLLAITAVLGLFVRAMIPAAMSRMGLGAIR
jgi:hypothetical protein